MWGRRPSPPKDDDSELPSSAERTPLVEQSPSYQPHNRDNDEYTTTTKQTTAHQRHVQVGSQVWTGWLSQEEEEEEERSGQQEEESSSRHDKDEKKKNHHHQEEDPWKMYISQKKLDATSLTTTTPPFPVDKSDINDDENNDDTGLLPEDTFAFLATTQVRSKAFWVALCTMATQFVVLCLLAVDSLSFANDDDDNDLPRNILSVPATSVLQVSLSQFLALLIASVSQSDCLQSVMLLHYGYHEHRVRHVLHRSSDNDDDMVVVVPHHLKVRWYLSIAARFTVGFCTGIVTFLLVVRSETVRDVMLDFTAVEFVSMLDDTAYLLGTVGFFGKHVQRETENPIYDANALTHHPFRRRRRHDPMRSRVPRATRQKIVKFLVTVATRTSLFWINMGFLIYIVTGQYNGRYLPDELLVQMGDVSLSLLSTHSGIYELTVPGLGEFHYKERGGTGIFTWCEAEQAWTLLDRATGSNCAQDWHVKSTELEQFAGMLAVSDQPWYVSETNNIELDADFVRVVSMLGVPTKCEHPVYGWTCSFFDPCESISVDASSTAFKDQRQRDWPTFFTLFPVDGVRVYEHPVYYSRESANRNADLIMFTGRQWAMLSTDIWTEDDNVLSDAELVKMLDGFRVYNMQTSMGIGFLSDFVDIGTENDRGTPIGLRWFEADTTGSDLLGIPKINERTNVPAQFFCATCNDSDRPCFYDAPCDNGRCVCDGENLGAVCEVVPSNDAFCNPSFNRPSFNFDGGDCCPNTCIDTADQKCLKSRNGLIDYGTALCRDRQFMFRRRLPLDEPDLNVQMANSGAMAATIEMTEDGRTYTLSNPLTDETVMGTRVGTTWTHLGGTHHLGGFRNEIVSQFPNAISSPRRSLPIRGLAASFQTRNLTAFNCNGLGCRPDTVGGSSTFFENNVVPASFEREDYWDPFALSPDGNVMARGVAVPNGETFRYYVNLFFYDPVEGWTDSNQRIDLSLNRTEPVEEFNDPSSCYNATGVSLLAFLEDNRLTLVDILGDIGMTVEEFVVALGIEADLSAANGTLTDEQILVALPLESIRMASFLEVVDFDASVYGIVFCGTVVLGQVMYTTEAPLYLSLSAMRGDRSRRLCVGSINFSERSPSELTGPLTTRVFEISSSGTLVADGPAVAAIDTSDMNGKSARAEFGLPKKSVSLSRNGNIVVVGSIYMQNGIPEGLVKVFERSGFGWVLRQQLSLGENVTMSNVLEGWTNLLSDDGSILAVSFPQKASLYRWNGTHYNLISDKIPFASGTDVSLSGKGGTVAFGVPIQGGFGSYVYSNDAAPWCDTHAEKQLRVSYTPSSPVAFAWRLVTAEDAILASGSWPKTSSEDPLSRNVRRHLLLEEEVVYDQNDPTDLTFVFDDCVDNLVCTMVYRLDNLGGSDLGVVYGRDLVPSTNSGNITANACLLQFQIF